MSWFDDLLGKHFKFNGAILPDRKTANFIAGPDADVVVEDNPVTGETDVTIGGSVSPVARYRAFTDCDLMLSAGDDYLDKYTIVDGFVDVAIGDTSGAYGVAEFSTGANTSGAYGCKLTLNIPSENATGMRFEVRARVPTLGAATDQFDWLIGFLTSQDAPADPCAYFNYDSDTEELTINNADGDSTVTAIAIEADAFYVFSVEISEDQSTAEFFVDGVSVGQLDMGVLSTMFAGVFIVKKGGGDTPRTMNVDYIDTWFNLSR